MTSLSVTSTRWMVPRWGLTRTQGPNHRNIASEFSLLLDPSFWFFLCPFRFWSQVFPFTGYNITVVRISSNEFIASPSDWPSPKNPLLNQQQGILIQQCHCSCHTYPPTNGLSSRLSIAYMPLLSTNLLWTSATNLPFTCSNFLLNLTNSRTVCWRCIRILPSLLKDLVIGSKLLSVDAKVATQC